MKSRFIYKSILALSLSLGITVFAQTPSSAVYNGARIVDNTIFLNAASMSENNIQSFLASKNSGLTSKTFLFNCAYDYQTEQWYRAIGAPCGQVVRASAIIYYAAQIYGINPQVILATLQKEQSLITNPYPDSIDLNYAMGYGCPTTGTCTTAGFFEQVDMGTWTLRYNYERASGNYNWWKPSSGWVCDGRDRKFYTPSLYPNQNVTFIDQDGVAYRTYYLANAATSSMYCYTPHAYNNPQGLYGREPFGTVGRYYSGSYNFVYFFEIWFGSPLTASYSWDVVTQYAFTDSSKTMPVGLNDLSPNQRIYLGVKIRNTGTATWSNSGQNPVRLGTSRSYDRSSAFYDATWLGFSRAATLQEASVAPGQIGTFEFWIKAPEGNLTNFTEYFAPLAEGKTWMPDIGLYFGITVQPANYSWRLVSQYAYTDNTKEVLTGLDNLQPGDRRYLGLRIQNTGNVTWKNSGNHPLRLGITHPFERHSAFMDTGWLGPSRPASMQEAAVLPGQYATFEFWVKAPANRPGLSREYFSPLIENKLWLQDIGLNYAISVIKPEYKWSIVSQYAFSDAAKTNPVGLDNMMPDQKILVGMRIKNDGNTVWSNSGDYPVSLGTSNPYDRSSRFCSTEWYGCSRPTRLIESQVAPGQIGTFEFWLKAPNTPGKSLEYFNPVAEGISWMDNLGLNFAINVR